MAKYVQRVLLGENPADLLIEHIDRLKLVINFEDRLVTVAPDP